MPRLAGVNQHAAGLDRLCKSGKAGAGGVVVLEKFEQAGDDADGGPRIEAGKGLAVEGVGLHDLYAVEFQGGAMFLRDIEIRLFVIAQRRRRGDVPQRGQRLQHVAPAAARGIKDVDTPARSVSAGLDTDKLPQALRLIVAELRRCMESTPTAAELRRARDYLIGQLDLGLEGTENQMMWLGEQLLGYGKVILPSQTRQRLGEVTPAQVRAAAREFFRPDRTSLAIVSPLKKEGRISRLLSW